MASGSVIAIVVVLVAVGAVVGYVGILSPAGQLSRGGEQEMGNRFACTDGDGGQNITIKAKCSDQLGSNVDSCLDNVTLEEWYCQGNECRSAIFNCTAEGYDACVDGACVNNPEPPECSDGIDNDGDGAVDWPADFSCSSSKDDDEASPVAACQDGVDNDGDGLVDFPADPGCASAQDNDEFNEPPGNDTYLGCTPQQTCELMNGSHDDECSVDADCANGTFPDLIVANYTYTATGKAPNMTLEITATVQNIGNAAAGTSRTYFNLVPPNQTNNVFTTSIPAGSWDDPTTYFYSLTSGNYTITITADAEFDVTESNEGNNVLTDQLSI